MSEEIDGAWRDWWIKFCEAHPQRKERTMNEFLTPKQLQEHQDQQTQPLLTEAIESISKAMIEAPKKNDMRQLRVDLRFEPVMPRVVALLKEKGWRSDWEAIWTRDNTGQPSHKTHIRLSLLLDIAPIS